MSLENIDSVLRNSAVKIIDIKSFDNPKAIIKKAIGFTMVEVLAAVAIIGITILGVGSILKSVAEARLKNSTVSQMIELESRVIRSFQNYNSFECKLPPATGAGSAKQALVNAVESTQALGTVLTPLADFTIPLINDGTPIASLTTTDGVNGVCQLPGFQLALANDTGGKTYVDKDLNILGSAAAPLNNSVFEILATIKCDGPAYNAATDKKKFCAAAYQIKVVDDPANPGRNITNIIPVGTMVWNATMPGNFPIRNTAADFNLAAGIGGADYNFHISTDVFRKVNIANVDAVSDVNDCSDGNMTDALFVTGYDRDTGKVLCAKKPVVDPGCGADEIPIGLKYDMMTGEVKTNCVQIFRQVRCPDARYVMNSVNLLALDSRQSPPSPPGTCVWAATASATPPGGTPTISPISGEYWVEADLCPKDYDPTGVSCSVSVNVADTSGGTCISNHNYANHPYVCGSYVCGTYSCKNVICGVGLCSVACTPGPGDPACIGSCNSTCPTYCNNYYCDQQNTYNYGATNLNFAGTATMVAPNRYRCSANALDTQPCDLVKHGDAQCGLDVRQTNPTWNGKGNFTFSYTCTKKAAIPNTINATY